MCFKYGSDICFTNFNIYILKDHFVILNKLYILSKNIVYKQGIDHCVDRNKLSFTYCDEKDNFIMFNDCSPN